MKSLTLAYLFALISAAPNNVSNHSTNQGINQITTNNCVNNNRVEYRSVWITYRNKYCSCYNTNSNSNSFNNQPEDLDYPFEIFTMDASRHLKQNNNCNNCNTNNNNNNSNNNGNINNNNYVRGSRNLDYEFDTRAKFNKYCRMFEDLDWYCSKGQYNNNVNNNANNNANNNVANANNSINNNSNANANVEKNTDDSDKDTSDANTDDDKASETSNNNN